MRGVKVQEMWKGKFGGLEEIEGEEVRGIQGNDERLSRGSEGRVSTGSDMK